MTENWWNTDQYKQINQEHGLAGPWPRFWAKLIDINIYGFFLGYLCSVVFPEFYSHPEFEGVGGAALFGAILLPPSLILDAIITGLTQTTLGRLIVGIKVATVERGPLTVLKALYRNTYLYLYGLGLGLGLIALFFYAHNFRKLRSGENTKWDEEMHTRVFQAGNNTTRTVIAVMILIVIYGLAVAGLSQAALRGAGIEQELKKAAADLKPQVIDPATRFDGAEAQGRILIYKYTVLEENKSRDLLKLQFEMHILPGLCTDADMLIMMNDYQVTYRYEYTLPGVSDPVSIDVSRDVCEQFSFRK